MLLLYCFIFILVIWLLSSSVEAFANCTLADNSTYGSQGFFFNRKFPEYVSMNFDTYPLYPYTSYFDKVKPSEILSTPIIWYNNKWFSTKFGISSGAGAYAISDEYDNDPNRGIGFINTDCMRNVHV